MQIINKMKEDQKCYLKKEKSRIIVKYHPWHEYLRDVLVNFMFYKLTFSYICQGPGYLTHLIFPMWTAFIVGLHTTVKVGKPDLSVTPTTY